MANYRKSTHIIKKADYLKWSAFFIIKTNNKDTLDKLPIGNYNKVNDW